MDLIVAVRFPSCPLLGDESAPPGRPGSGVLPRRSRDLDVVIVLALSEPEKLRQGADGHAKATAGGTAALPGTGTARHDPICGTIGDCVNTHFACVVINTKSNAGFAP